MGDHKITFEKEVAETLGIEAAIILELYKSKKFDESLDEKKLFNLIASECSFIEIDNLKANFDKLKRVKLIEFKVPLSYSSFVQK